MKFSRHIIVALACTATFGNAASAAKVGDLCHDSKGFPGVFVACRAAGQPTICCKRLENPFKKGGITGAELQTAPSVRDDAAPANAPSHK